MGRILLLISLVFGSCAVYADNNEEIPAVTESGKLEQKGPGDVSPEKKSAEAETPDTFDPTEKLSEDIPAIFPVDI